LLQSFTTNKGFFANGTTLFPNIDSDFSAAFNPGVDCGWAGICDVGFELFEFGEEHPLEELLA
jgi:hypothetical protein